MNLRVLEQRLNKIQEESTNNRSDNENDEDEEEEGEVEDDDLEAGDISDDPSTLPEDEQPNSASAQQQQVSSS